VAVAQPIARFVRSARRRIPLPRSRYGIPGAFDGIAQRSPAPVDTEHRISHIHLVDLLLNQLKLAIRDLLARKGIRARVLEKTNAQGERVIGIIIDRDQKPPPNGG
jgi:hypothetical protein